MKIFPITYDGELIGQAKISPIGSFCHISCRCKPLDPGRYRIMLTGQKKALDLGLCVPMGEDYGLDMHIAKKRVGEGDILFILCRDQPGKIYPIQLPFAYLHLLKSGKLGYINELPVLISVQAKQDSDLSP